MFAIQCIVYLISIFINVQGQRMLNLVLGWYILLSFFLSPHIFIFISILNDQEVAFVRLLENVLDIFFSKFRARHILNRWLP